MKKNNQIGKLIGYERNREKIGPDEQRWNICCRGRANKCVNLKKGKDVMMLGQNV